MKFMVQNTFKWTLVVYKLLYIELVETIWHNMCVWQKLSSSFFFLFDFITLYIPMLNINKSFLNIL